MGLSTVAPPRRRPRSALRSVLRSALPAGLLALWFLHPRAGLASFELDPADPLERGSATLLAVGLAGADPAAWVESSPPESVHSSRPSMVRLYAFRPFGIREVDFAAVAVRVPVGVRFEQVTVSYQRLGALSYTEEVYLVSARFATRRGLIEPAIRLGTVRDGEIFRDHAWLVDLGAEVRPAAAIRVAARLKNLLGSGLAGEGSRCPMGVAAGVGLAVSGNLGFGVEVEKESGFPLCVASGVEFRAAGGLALRAGTKTYPREIACGIGFRRGWLALDVGSSVNLELGATHEAGVTLFWE